MKTIIGVFDEMTQAQAAIRDLQAAGFPREKISLLANNSENRYATETTATDTGEGDRRANHAMAGAGIGAAAGGLGGLLLGLGALAIPGIGPIIAAGPLAAALAGAGIGAAAGGVIGALTSAGVPEEHAHTYAEAVRRGGHLVSVGAEDNLAERAVEIMDRHGAVDVERRAATWRQQGWKGYDTAAKPLPAAEITREREAYRAATPAATARNATAPAQNLQAEKRIPVVEESIAVGKREVQGGGVRVFSHVIERPVQEQVNLRQEKVVVERRPVDRPVGTTQGAEWDSFREGTIEMTEKSEQAVVQKTARVVEEVVVGKQVTNQTQTVRDTVRKTDVKVEQIPAAGVRAFETYDSDFRRDYQTNYATSGMTFDQFQPVYRYGYDAAADPRYAGRDWSALEPELRRDWEARNPGGVWERAKNSVRFAWDKVRNRN